MYASEGCPLFCTDLPGGQLVLPNVVLCQKHSLGVFNLVSMCDEPLRIQLRTDLSRAQLCFQLENANVVGNNVDYENFNEVFNRFNAVDEVLLPAGATVRVIVAFSPLAEGQSLAEAGDIAEDEVQSHRPRSDSDEFFPKRVATSYDVTGHLIFAIDGDLTRQNVARFTAKVFRSIMNVEVEELVFDDCVPGATYVKDFSVWNLSEIPLHFSVNHALASPLQTLLFSVFDDGDSVVRQEIGPFSHLRIRVAFNPRELGKADYLVRLENYDNDTNYLLRIHTVVTSETRKEAIVLSTGGTLDFGDCLTGECTTKPVTIRNVGDCSFDINLSTDSDENVTFHTKEDVSLSLDSVSEIVADDGDARRSRTTELTLLPGRERTLIVAYTPDRDKLLHEAKAARFTQRSFRMILQYRETEKQQAFTKSVKGTARVCTSLVRLSTTQVNFGSTIIGSSKVANVRITNISDMPATLKIHLNSHILTCTPLSLIIPPRQWQELGLTLIPTRANDDYRKQITIENKKHRANDQAIEVRANCVDRHRVTFHTFFYSLFTSSNSNMLDFGAIVVNSPSLRTFRLRNTSSKPLTLAFSVSQPEEMKILCEGEPTFEPTTAARTEREAILESIDTSTTQRAGLVAFSRRNIVRSRRTRSASLPPDGDRPTPQTTAPGFLSPESITAMSPVSQRMTMQPTADRAMAAPSAMRSAMTVPMSLTVSAVPGTPQIGGHGVFSPMSTSRESVNSGGSRNLFPAPIVSPPIEIPSHVVEASALARSFELKEMPYFFDSRGEEMHVKGHIARMEALERGIATGKLQTLSELTLPPDGSALVYVYFRPDPMVREHVHGRTRKIEEKIYIRMIKYDVDLAAEKLGGLREEIIIPVRELPVRARICRSEIHIGQKHISFGKVQESERIEKRLVLDNKSDQPMLYRIRKSGNIDSRTIQIVEGRYGIVRPWGRKEVEFAFEPRFQGPFAEKLTVHNVCDPTQNVVIALKAEVVRAPSFSVTPSGAVYFGTVVLTEASPPMQFVVKNISKKPRKYEILLNDREHAKCQLHFQVSANIEGATLLEQLECKLRRVISKHHEARAAELRGIIEALPVDAHLTNTMSMPVLKAVYKKNKAVFSLNPNQITTINVVLQVRGEEIAPTVPMQDISGQIAIQESTKLGVQTIPFNAVLISSDHVSVQQVSPIITPQPVPRLARSLSTKVDPLKVMLSSISIDPAFVHEPASFQFTIINASAADIVYSCNTRPFSKLLSVHAAASAAIANPLVTFEGGSESSLPAGGSKQVLVHFTPQTVGKHKHEVVVTNVATGNEQTITVQVNALPPKFLTLPDIVDDRLSFGMCYVAPSQTYCGQRTVRLINLRDEEMQLSIMSNIPAQVFFFRDAALCHPIETLTIAPLAELPIFVALKPHITDDVDACRVLVGGVKISNIPSQQGGPLFDYSFKLTATVGRSTVNVLPAGTVDLGAVRDIGATCRGSFVIRNKSQMLPLAFKLDTSAEDMILAVRAGEILATASNPDAKFVVEFSVAARAFGLRRETITITNSNTGEQTVVPVRLFVDEGLLTTDTDIRKNGLLEVAMGNIYVVPADPQQSHFQLAHGSHSVTTTFHNVSDRDLVLQPLSNIISLRLSIATESPASAVDRQVTSSADAKGMLPCGAVFQVAARSSVTAIISLSKCLTRKLATLRQLAMVNWKGAILLQEMTSEPADQAPEPRILQSLLLTGSYGLSIGMLDTSELSVGKVGFVSGFVDVPFSVLVRNVSGIPLELALQQLPAGLYLDAQTVVVAGESDLRLHGCVQAAKLAQSEEEVRHLSVMLANKNNTDNVLSLTVAAEISRCQVECHHLDDTDIVLPALPIPGCPDVVRDQWFTVDNRATSGIPLSFDLEVDDRIGKLVQLQILLRDSLSPLEQFDLSGGAKLDVLVRASAKPDAVLPGALKTSPPPMVQYGFVHVRTNSHGDSPVVIESIPIRGTLLQGVSFALSDASLQLSADSDEPELSTSFTVTNLLGDVPLHFVVRVPAAQEGIVCTADPADGVILESAVVKLRIAGATGNHQLSVVVADARMPDAVQMVALHITRAVRLLASPVAPTGATPVNSFPVIEDVSLKLKGLKDVGGQLYEMDMGQKTIGSGDRAWTFTLENTGGRPVPFKISTVSETDDQWLQIAPLSGMVHKDSVEIHLRFLTNRMGVFSTYVMIENEDNPDDLKSIRCNMEVVSTTNQIPKTPSLPIFSVLVDGRDDPQPVIKAGLVSYNHLYRNRSFEIVNHTDMPLDFLLGSDLARQSTELNFSLSYTSSKFITSFTISASSRRTVFIHFRPAVPFEAPASPMSKMYSIFVTCRLIKDHRKVITLRALCQHPQLEVSRHDCAFVLQDISDPSAADIDSRLATSPVPIPFDRPRANSVETLQSVVTNLMEGTDELDGGIRTVIVRNLSERPMDYSIVNDSLFFLVEAPKLAQIAPHGAHTLSVRPNREAIGRQNHLLFKGKYAEEHFTVYNKQTPTEKTRVSLRLTGPDVMDYFAAPLARTDHPFVILENRIMTLLRRFRTFWGIECPLIGAVAKQLSTCEESLLTKLRDVVTAGAAHREVAELLFAMHVITDALIFYGIRGQGGQVPFQLASMVYSMLFRHDVFVIFLHCPATLFPVTALGPWVKQLRFFLTFFPGSPEVLVLRTLSTKLTDHYKVAKTAVTRQKSAERL
eukprot:TRINITY_DN2946_c0_g1_i1.p1 TRINITY_DN2946_c0_g1~~TRINITY_DN2946_c0_g1_i1.p1  ORF type:complete len:2682 (+),score=550.34 TRINITY_DN2946_c0_g1_i1:90-8135(+)